MDAVVDYLPSPLDVPPIKGIDPRTDAEIKRKTSDTEPFAALAFKLQTDPFVGQLTFFRVYSGTIESGTYIYNSTTEKKERLGRILRMHANEREEVKKVYAGEIAAAVGLKDTRTSDTLCDENNPVILEKIEFMKPVVSVRIEPKTKADQEKMGIALKKLSDEDPTFTVSSDEETMETIISGMGELHLEILVDRMKREFKVEANVGKPQVAYKMDLFFDVAGSVNAPALVLVHGSVVTRKMWLPQLRGLSDVYRIIAPDLPGHGVLAQEPFTFTAAVQMLAELIDREAKGRALVAGLSLGGYIAIELAVIHPDRVPGLVLSGCSFNTGAMGLYLKFLSGLMQRGWLKQSHAQAED